MGQIFVDIMRLRKRLKRSCLALGAAVLGVAPLLFFPSVSGAAFEEGLETSCVECHLKAEVEYLVDPVKLWSKSVHAEVGNTCDGCHGGNPNITGDEAMADEHNFVGVPEKEDVVEFCGKCHQELSSYFTKSAHSKTEAQNCVGCHGSHMIQRISLDIINPSKCTKCHEFGKPLELRNILQSIHALYADAKDKAQNITGFPTDRVKAELDKAWKQLREVRILSHTFDLELIAKEAGKVEEKLKGSDSEIHRLLEMVRERKLLGYGLICVFSIIAVSIYLINRELD